MKIKVINGEPYGSPMDFGARQVDEAVWKNYIPVAHDNEDVSNIVEEQYDAGEDVVKQVLVSNPNYSTALSQDTRIHRNNLLESCDWTQMPDSPLNDEKKSQWSIYRQLLRDVPDQSGFPLNITWPTEPS